MPKGVKWVPLLLLVVLISCFTNGSLGARVLADGDITILPIDPPSEPFLLKVRPGDIAEFSWEFMNSGNDTYEVSLTPQLLETSLGYEISSSNLVLHPGGFERVYLNVSGTEEYYGNGSLLLIINATNTRTGTYYEDTLELTVEFREEGQQAIPSIVIVFVSFAAIIFIGFFATLIFERTKIPDLLILLFLGLFLGPIAATYFNVVLVPREYLDLVTPYFAALALVIILFDGGLNLSFEQLLRNINITFAHTVLTFFLSVLVIAGIAYFVLGYPVLIGILLGVILGGVSSAVVITIVRRMNIREDTAMILTVESVLTDVLCIIVAISLIEFLKGGETGTASGVLGNLAAAFSIAIVVGLFFGIFWLRMLKRLYGTPFSFMITIAALFILYGAVEFVGGSGAIAALMFGLVLGNKEEFARMFKMKTKFVLDEKIKQFHSELSFVVRTFFFVFLGLAFSLSLTGSINVKTGIPFLTSLNGTLTLFILGVILIFVGIVAVRYVVSFLTVSLHEEITPDRTALWIMMGRGLAPAVLASLPFAIAEFVPGNPYFDLMNPYKSQFINIAFLIIVMTVIGTTIGVVVNEQKDVGKTPLELAKERLRREREIEELKKWKREKKEMRRRRIEMKKHERRMKKLEKKGKI